MTVMLGNGFKNVVVSVTRDPMSGRLVCCTDVTIVTRSGTLGIARTREDSVEPEEDSLQRDNTCTLASSSLPCCFFLMSGGPIDEPVTCGGGGAGPRPTDAFLRGPASLQRGYWGCEMLRATLAAAMFQSLFQQTSSSSPSPASGRKSLTTPEAASTLLLNLGRRSAVRRSR
ncbi:hypothetical protein EYF80_033933 [Liparis tanakae]|uniref:Uncharacterized protein n=1 Tax=Liparis tanakae TaxID=230148 RepID=A0A4Z2GRW0_9TELE|nr:hypothetical protein EYF80_033933 [Liparis tanakae]